MAGRPLERSVFPGRTRVRRSRTPGLLAERTRRCATVLAVALALVAMPAGSRAEASVKVPLLSAAQEGEPGEGEAPPVEGKAEAAPPWAEIHFHLTTATQAHPSFYAKYSGANSLSPQAESATAFVSGLNMEARLWRGAELVLDPELSGGYGLSSTLGVAAFPSGIVYRVGNPAPAIYLARLLLRQTLGLGGGRVPFDEGDGSAGLRDRATLTLTVGRLSVTDVFDGNAYAHDPETQFFNWALFASGAWDYPADTRGYTWGVLADFSMDFWSVKAGIALEPQYANLLPLEWDLTKARGLMAEYDVRYRLLGRGGTGRVLLFLNQARMGSYAEVLANPAAYGNSIAATRADGREKYGAALSWDQQVTDSLGVFLRASIDDGATESWAFTEIDRSLGFGAVESGSLFGLRDYEAGGALVIDGLSRLHRLYLQGGGYGFILGDGQLNYAPEIEGDFYLRVHVTPLVDASVLYQPIFDPGYNKDRGPVQVFSGRVHIAF
ncbi:MAG TPA: carbohydrate porin [Anaeromyxobacteraceae bacterium]|nr:carbohydrate porin [Anaeromyxobacteraceae bacterium]